MSQQFGDHEIDLIKCDCEGGEYTIIEQLTPAIAARIRNLSIEVTDLDSSRNRQTIWAKLSSLGYKLFCIPNMWERSTCICCCAPIRLICRRPFDLILRAGNGGAGSD